MLCEFDDINPLIPPIHFYQCCEVLTLLHAFNYRCLMPYYREELKVSIEIEQKGIKGYS